jgi:hypothetical protein
VQNGNGTRFWEDVWRDNKKIKHGYPCMYNIVRKKDDIVVNVLSIVPLNVSFRRTLKGNVLNKWFELVGKIINVDLKDQRDEFV